jgi:uncharacterized membrane protein
MIRCTREGITIMSNLFVLGFDEPQKAEEVSLQAARAARRIPAPGGSALFVLVRRPSPDRERVLKELKGIGGKILKTSVTHEDAAKLQAALSAAG